MANKYEKEIEKETLIRDALILERIGAIYTFIRDKARGMSKSVTDKANKDQSYFTKGTNQTDFEKEFSEAVRPEYVKRDGFSKKVYAEEYNTAYFQAKFTVENQGIAKGFNFDLPDYTDKQFKEARDYALSKLMNKSKMTTGRNLNIAQLEDIIVSGVQRGLSLTNINKEMDIALGFRDEAGKWVAKIEDRKRQTYETQRILRTEVLRMRSDAETDQWLQQQSVVPSKLQDIETLDKVTRRQSAIMDGDFSNSKGEFLYPDGNWYRLHKSGIAKYDVNDRGSTINVDPEYPPETRIQRDPETNKNTIQPFQNFQEYAKDNNLTHNIYGEYILK